MNTVATALRTKAIRVLAVALAGLTCSCGQAELLPEGADGLAPCATPAEVRELTRGPARVVWCQDAGDGSDVMAERDQILLMGYDTEDRRGGRPILPDRGNYVKPSITPRGDRVVFSSRTNEKVYVVNWDGTGLREIADGFALSAWQDPSSGTEWVYYGADIILLKSPSFQTIRRAQIDDPAVSEIVWSNTITSQDFEPSADGRRAAGCFPWPDCGVAKLPGVSWKRYSAGCWPSLSPDNRYILWVFDGAHRNLSFFTQDGGEPWQINLTSAPGVDGFEVYHPRWGNHPRLLAMSGPYKMGEGAVKIGDGGEEVEIYIGRFSEDLKSVEKWLPLTRNRKGDFYPDIWTRAGRDAKHPPGVDLADAGPGDWPVNRTGLRFVWENRGADNEIRDGGTRICRVEPHGEAKYGRFLDMNLSGGTFAAESGTRSLVEAIRETGEFTLEAWVTPEADSGPEWESIIRLAGDGGSALALGGRNRQLFFRLHDGSREGRSWRFAPLTPGVAHHVVVTCQGDDLMFFVNGQPRKTVEGACTNLASLPPGDLLFGDGRWRGSVEGVALYNRAMGSEETMVNVHRYAQRFADRKPARSAVVDARLVELSNLPTPESVSPYRRALVGNVYELVGVVEGDVSDPRFVGAHWAILDARMLADAGREVGKVYRMTIERYDERPELEGERMVSDTEEFLLPVYLQTGN